MAEAALCHVAEVILANLGSRAVHEIACVWGFKTQLGKLKNTINTIKDMLLDALARQLQSHAVRGWLERIIDVVYDADDLFDKFATLVSQKEAMSGNKFTKELRIFFSDSNQIAFAFTLSRKIKKIREDLDDIVNDGNQFGFVLRPYEEGLHTMSGNRSHSFMDSDEIIGRDDDKEAILDMLLVSGADVLEHVSVIPIVGIGGLGKTALAQYVYNDVKVQERFELRLWVCVSDIFDIGEIIKKILMSATDIVPQQLEIDQLQGHLRKIIGGKRYLLVLDDVWNEDREKWLELRAVLNNGRNGSMILVTTRSGLVAKIMGTFPSYNLDVLSEDKSWDLFEKMAFEPRQDQRRQVLEKLGKEIVKKCGNVPLAIRALGSLLYGEDERKWLSLKDKSLVELSTGNNVMSILRLSYLNLWSLLKLCFAYCALFPKDYELERKTLINLWMAEGFIVSTEESQNLEEIGEEYFSALLQRCFFQDISKDELGNIKSCKLHDLMHDLAKDVAGADNKLIKFGETIFKKSIRHFSIGYSLNSSRKIPRGVLNLKLLRTFLLPTQIKDGSALGRSTCNQMISNFRRLRVLDLHNLEVKILPSSICKMVHLRYLNLSMTPIKMLPESIAELQNLQTVELYACYRLKKLPTNIRKLISLRNLDVDECPHLTHMPSGLRELTSLHRLTRFTVNNRYHPTFLSKPRTAQLRDLKTVRNLRESLRIEILGELEDPLSDAKEANLSSKHGLTELRIHGATWPNKGSDDEHDEALLEGLKPHYNLRKLEILGFRGEKLPSWANMHNLVIYLPNLTEINLHFCRRWQMNPVFSRLPSLKRLFLVSLWRVE